MTQARNDLVLETIDACLAGKINRMDAYARLEALQVRGTFTYSLPRRFAGLDYVTEKWIRRNIEQINEPDA